MIKRILILFALLPALTFGGIDERAEGVYGTEIVADAYGDYSTQAERAEGVIDLPSGGGVGSYLVEEDFEETGVPSSGEFSVALGSINWDATPPTASPNGGEALSTTDRNNNAAVATAGDEAYFQVYFTSLGFSSTGVYYIEGTNGQYAEVVFNDAGEVILAINPGAATATLTDSYSSGVWYHVKLVVDPGVKTSLEVSTDGTFSGSGTSYVEVSSLTLTTPYVAAEIRGRRSATMYLDRFLTTNEAITDNP